MGKVLITGATGFLGGALVNSLQQDGIDIVATGRDIQKLDRLPLHPSAKVAIDLADRATLLAQRKRFEGVDTIVHCAALSSPWGPWDAFKRANVHATENIIGLAKDLAGARLVHISSPTVYFRFEDQFAMAESTPLPAPVNAYAATKVLAEDRVRASGLQATILRPRGIYGAGDQALLPRLLHAAQRGAIPLFREGRASTDLTHVSDVVRAIRAALERDVTGTFNVSGGVALSIRAVIDQVCALHRVPVRWRPLPFRPCLAAARAGEFLARLRPGRPEPRVTAYGLGILGFSQTLDLSAAQKALGWVPSVPFDEGLARTFAGQASP